MTKTLKKGLSVRGDSVYCPLAFSLDSYWNCEADCWHCYFRHLNRTWGQDLRPLDVAKFKRDLANGLKNKNPKSPLAHCLAKKKTLRWGNKSDPFQEAERKHRIAKEVFPELISHDWTFVIQTRHTHVLEDYVPEILQAHEKGLITLLPVMSPGLDKDWELFERSRTTQPRKRLHFLRQMRHYGVPSGVNGEPFIPGVHTVEDFRDALLLLKSYGIGSYNTYNFHFNAFVCTRLHRLGVDIEKIWYYNRDEQWRPILQQLLDLAKKYDIVLGCPDFVNSGPTWVEQVCTCCGIDVPNPTTFNTHHWKRLAQEGLTANEIIERTWDGSGNREEGEGVVRGTRHGFYTLEDAGTPPRKGEQ